MVARHTTVAGFTLLGSGTICTWAATTTSAVGFSSWEAGFSFPALPCMTRTTTMNPNRRLYMRLALIACVVVGLSPSGRPILWCRGAPQNPTQQCWSRATGLPQQCAVTQPAAAWRTMPSTPRPPYPDDKGCWEMKRTPYGPIGNVQVPCH